MNSFRPREIKRSSSHIPIINSLRGVAAAAVCFYHFVCTTIDYVDDELILSFFHYGQKGVQLFFIISGIVIPLSMIGSNYSFKGWRAFILKRFIRIEPPYLVAVAVASAYLIARNYVPGTVGVDMSPSGFDMVLHLGYLIPFFDGVDWVNPVFWTLAVEFQYYLALSLLFPLLLAGKLSLRCLFYTLFMGGGFLRCSAHFFPAWGPYFLVGIIYALNRAKVIRPAEFWGVAILLAPVIYFRLGPVDLTVAVASLIIIQCFAEFQTSVTLFLGKISYSLYLLHSVIGTGFINFMSRRYTEPYQKVAVILTGFAVSVLCACILYRLVERPTHRFAQRIGGSLAKSAS